MRGKYEHKPPEMEGRSPQSGKFLERLACIGPDPCDGADNGAHDGMGAVEDDHNKNDDGNGSVVVGAMVAMVMLMVLLFKGILGHGSEVGFWSILDGDGSSLGVLCQPH